MWNIAPKTPQRLALAAALLLAAAPTLAASSASATLHTYYWKLSDLDLNDGIRPSLKLYYNAGYSFADSWLHSDSRADPGSRDECWVRGTFKDCAASADTAWGHATGSTSAALSTTEASVQGSLGRTGVPVVNRFDTVVSPATSYDGYPAPETSNFTLSPHTGAVVVFVVSAWARTTVGSNGLYAEDAWAGAKSGYSVDHRTWVVSEYSEVSAGAVRTDTGFAGEYNVYSGTTSFYVANTSGAPLTVEFFVELATRGQSPFITKAGLASPVPEPGSLALWFAGLAVLGGAARRRRAVQ